MVSFIWGSVINLLTSSSSLSIIALINGFISASFEETLSISFVESAGDKTGNLPISNEISLCDVKKFSDDYF
jgi:hypothetical protein